jgi:type 1 glutamine amidotransferase
MGLMLTALLAINLVARDPGGEPGPSPKTIVFLGGCKTHGPGAHEHLRGVQLLKQCIDTAPNIPRVRTQIYLDTWPKNPSELDDATTIVLMWEGWEQHLINARNLATVQKFDQLMKRGVGLVCFHAATAVDESVEKYYLDWIGGNKSRNHSLHPMARLIEVTLAAPEHAICRGVRAMRFAEEEFYCKILFRADDRRITSILTAMLPPERPQKQIIGWVVERADGGRAFACTGPHYHASFQNDDLRKLALNAVLWTARIEVPRNGVQSTVSPVEFQIAPAAKSKAR